MPGHRLPHALLCTLLLRGLAGSARAEDAPALASPSVAVLDVELGKRAFVMAFLGGKTAEARFAHFAKLVAWLGATSP